MVGSSDVVHCYDLLGFNLAEHGDFFDGALLEGDIASACNLQLLTLTSLKINVNIPSLEPNQLYQHL